MCDPAQSLRRPWPRGCYHVARAAWVVPPKRGDGDGPVAAQACAARRRPSASRGRGGAITSRERHGACPTRGDGDGPVAAHACAAWRRPSGASASRGRGGAITLREAGCARLAAMVTGRWRHTHVRPGAGPPPAVAEGGLSRRASGMGRARRAAMVTGLWRHTHMCGPVQALRRFPRPQPRGGYHVARSARGVPDRNPNAISAGLAVRTIFRRKPAVLYLLL
jgi:hypothetical protein